MLAKSIAWQRHYIVLFLLVVVGICLFSSGSVRADFASLPTTLPDPNTGNANGNEYIAVSNFIPANGAEANGANIPDAWMKLYTQTPPPNYSPTESDRKLFITIKQMDDPASCGPYILNFEFESINSNEQTSLVGTPQIQSLNVFQCSSAYTVNVPNSSWVQSLVPNHAGLYVAVLHVFLCSTGTPLPGGTNKCAPDTSSYFKVSTSDPDQPATGLGYIGENNNNGVSNTTYITLRPAPDSGQPSNLIWNFQATCTANGGPPLIWGDDDYGTSVQPPGYGMDQPPKRGMVISVKDQNTDSTTMLAYTVQAGKIVGQPNYTAAGPNSNPPALKVYSGSNKSITYQYTWLAGHDYTFEITNVAPGNGIWASIPFDSGDYNLPCATDNHGPTANINTVTCNGNAGPTVNFTFGDQDDNSQAQSTLLANGQPVAQETGGGTYNYSKLATYVGFAPVTYELVVPDIQSDGSPGTAFSTATSTATATCPPTVSCGTLTSGGDGEAGQPFTIKFPVTYTQGSNNDAPPNTSTGSPPYFYMDVNSSLLPSGSDKVEPTTTPPGTSGTATGMEDINNSTSTGTYSATWTFQDSDGTPIKLVDGSGNPVSSCGGSLTLYNYPYVSFLGNDVSAGSGFGDNCTSGAGNIYTYLDTSGSGSPYPKGSGVQFGAEALGIIEGLDSNSLGVAGSNYSGLTFANSGTGTNVTSGNTPHDDYGGNYGLSPDCGPNYYGTLPSNQAVTASGSPTISAGNSSGIQYYTPPTGGALTIGNGINYIVSSGVNQTIYVDGNVYIANNICYAGDLATGTCGSANYDPSWKHVADIPSLFIIAKGNILIGPGVTELDGVYIAQPDSSAPSGTPTGVINTCALNSTAAYPVSQIYSNCDNQLTVNGSFVAQNIFLDRSYSSLRYGQSGENTITGTAHTCGTPGTDVPLTDSGSHLDCAAEIFNFSPELYMSQPAGLFNSSASYQYFTSLPPVL